MTAFMTVFIVGSFADGQRAERQIVTTTQPVGTYATRWPR